MLGFSFANKLKKKHITWQKHKMHVNLAVQTLSNSVADAIDFLCDELAHSKFQRSEVTTEFIRQIDVMFDLLNSKYPFLKGTKAPVTLTSFSWWSQTVMKHVLSCWASGIVRETCSTMENIKLQFVDLYLACSPSKPLSVTYWQGNQTRSDISWHTNCLKIQLSFWSIRSGTGVGGTTTQMLCSSNIHCKESWDETTLSHQKLGIKPLLKTDWHK